MKLIDISQPVSPDTAVFPGDTPFSMRTRAWSDRCMVGEVTTTLHIGTHADLPAHIAAGIAPPPLDAYVGPARVVAGPAGEIDADVVASWGTRPGERILVRGGGYLNAASGSELSRLVLYGTDAASVDHPASRDLPAHHELIGAGVAILENLVLDHVEPGSYELVALPLRIDGADATPVRAVLRLV